MTNKEMFAYRLLNGEYREHSSHNITWQQQVKDLIFPLSPIRGDKGFWFEYADWIILSGIFGLATILYVVAMLLWL